MIVVFHFWLVPCTSDEFRCFAGFVCVDKLQVCDKYEQCMDGSDDFKSGKLTI